ncbi:hypothetical protein GCM10023149_38770 [Mucilaginibacter gynuensis]|uniref:Adhesin n=1 Tax=Mucilaginibacter gynuensis TaxID=1302236 RepID=A0ABP8H134_9SPHI
MKSKVYNPALFVLMAFLAISTPGLAQNAIAVPPTPPATPAPQVNPVPHVIVIPKAYDISKDKDYQKSMAKLQTQMKELQKKMSKLKLDKNLNKTLTYTFKNLDKTITTSVNSSLSSVNTDLDINFDHFEPLASVNYDTNSNTILISGDNNIQTQDLDEQVKTYSKSYAADRNDVLSIDNRYGKVTINTWTKNEFKVDVQIKVGTNREGEAKKMLDNVNISDGKDGETVWFKTKIDDESNGGSWSSLFSGRKVVRKMEINYIVYMPVKNGLIVSNRYGATVLPDLTGKLNINSAYGNLTAKNLSNPDNVIKVKYGSANIEGLVGSDLDVAYGSLVLGASDKLTANVSYGSAKIGSIKTSGNINVRYSGTLNIATLDRNLKALQVNSSYSGVKVGMGALDNVDFDVTVHYGSFNYDNNTVSVVNQTPSEEEKGWSSTKNYKGKLGKGNGDKVITIKSSYGSVKFE